MENPLMNFLWNSYDFITCWLRKNFWNTYKVLRKNLQIFLRFFSKIRPLAIWPMWVVHWLNHAVDTLTFDHHVPMLLTGNKLPHKRPTVYARPSYLIFSVNASWEDGDKQNIKNLNLSLRVVKICRNSNNGILHIRSQVVFCNNNDLTETQPIFWSTRINLCHAITAKVVVIVC